jgi:hypothetical protein
MYNLKEGTTYLCGIQFSFKVRTGRYSRRRTEIYLENMLTLVHLPYLKAQVKMHKLWGLTPYDWKETKKAISGGPLFISKDRLRRAAYRLSIGIHFFSAIFMAARMQSKEFAFFYFILGCAFLSGFVNLFPMRLNWSLDDGTADCLNSMIRFERVLINEFQPVDPKIIKGDFLKTNSLK